ncbi:MAG: 16S rRNA (guanine(527)-N(7))-methyltransferase RsmG [Planctomycetes bacterium]|nr:16S rRNA (guanine(527)-N(7))-methyltransferase RsmG [Planctomycetota bacterium]
MAELGIPVSPSQLDAMARHYAAMVEANREFNLTRITDPTEAAVKHYADSLAMLRLVEERGWQVASVLDIGTGAGFPAIPLAIMRPEWRITALDGTKKKIDFLSSIAKELNLSNLCPIHAHSDHWKCGTAFDIVTGRAVSKLDEFIPSAVRLVSPSGHIVAYKTDPLPEAEQSATSTLPEKLSVEWFQICSLALACN